MIENSFEIQQLRDFENIQDLGSRTYFPHYTYLWYDTQGIEWYMERCFGDNALKADFENPDLLYFAVRLNGKNVGFLKLVKHKTPLENQPKESFLYLEKIYFLKEATGLGLGQKAMAWVDEQARQWGINKVWLMAMDSSLKTIQSYEKAGFVKIATTRLDDEVFCRLRAELRGMVVLQKVLF